MKKIFKNIHFVKRDPECTNVLFCSAEVNTDESKWEECDEFEIHRMKCIQLETCNGVTYYGYL